jgi:uncharacterized heparinase superfamily protein
MAFTDQPRRMGGAVSGALRRFGSGLSGLPGLGLSFSGPTPERLVIAPPDLRTPDPTVAQEIYAGVFFFSGKSITTGGRNPFLVPPPSTGWERDLHSFGWLRHLGAAGDPLSATNAQALVKEWTEACPKPRDGIAWEPETAARRLISWLCHSVLIVERADVAGYRRFLKSIGQHIRLLRTVAGSAQDGLPRLMVQLALAYADICVAMARPAPMNGLRGLDGELARQILPDGSHVSRNPGVLAEILGYLLPLRQSFSRIGTAPSTELISAIDRMMLALRFMRMGDGSIGHFNGMGETPQSLVATLLRYDDVMGDLPRSAPYSGYQRLVGGNVIMIMDTGRPPASEISQYANAGVLSFEMSDGQSPLVVNCGAPPVDNAEAVLAARSTAAHSAIVLNDSSSCRFAAATRRGGTARHVITAGPQKIGVHREQADDGDLLIASHDGYARQFLLLLERSIFLSANGYALSGTDRFSAAPGKRPSRQPPRDSFAIRFHLHPTVEAARDGQTGNIMLVTRDGNAWVFQSPDAPAELEESIFFASSDGARRTRQIVIRGSASAVPEVRWSFSRT